MHGTRMEHAMYRNHREARRQAPTGIRVSDAVAWARQILELYGELDCTSNNAQGLL